MNLLLPKLTENEYRLLISSLNELIAWHPENDLLANLEEKITLSTIEITNFKREN